MTQTDSTQRPALDWLTVAAFAALAISLTVAFHEGIHALTCMGVGGDLREYSALHVDCSEINTWQSKLVAGSASIANLLLGTLCWRLLPRFRRQASNWTFFLWLFMLMNWLFGAGYWMFSGIGNIGDWSVVIAGWEPQWLWRVVMTLVGTLFYVFFIWLSLHELGKFIGGTAPELFSRATKLGLLAYTTAGLVTLSAGALNPYGLLGLPAIAGLMATLGALSPLLWMMQWFKASHFIKAAGPPLAIERRWGLVALGGLVAVLYVVVLGRTLYF